MQHDREVIISTAPSRKAVEWPQEQLLWSDFVARLASPYRSGESFAEYLALAKAEQDELKDVGGFVGGQVAGRRKCQNIQGRDLITLDLDSLPANGTQVVVERLQELGWAWAVYSTRKHERYRPRLRVVVPAERTVSREQYEPLARQVAVWLGLEFCDPTTFEVARLMYWPSCARDGEYFFQFADKPLLRAEEVLALYGPGEAWREVSRWPQLPGSAQSHRRQMERQGDPKQKPGLVGAFCRSFDVLGAIAEFLPSCYQPAENGRYSFTGGSTTGGAVVYEGGSFLYSHHATDPAGGRLCNAFDLVRLHRFGKLDEEAKPDTPVNRLPSYAEMCEFAGQLKEVTALLQEERYEKAGGLLGETKAAGQAAEASCSWLGLLQTDRKSGAFLRTSRNVQLVLEYDPRLKGRIRFDEFTEYVMAKGPLPWSGREEDGSLFRWADGDDAGLRDYLQQLLGWRQKDIIDDGLLLSAKRHCFNPLRDYLKGQAWDGEKRLERLFVDYMGAEDCEYVRAVTKKAFAGAVARAMQPGVKFDTMIVLHGKPGIGKSTLFAWLGKDWFSDSLRSFEKGKDAAELLQGVWLVELSEMEAYKRSDIRAVKSFLSKCDDQYRAAYARKTEKHLRKCVFFGTTNDFNYLSDPTGNRRFWPVDAGARPASKCVFRHLKGELDQLWAEAYVYWQLGEPLYLDARLEAEAEKRRDEHFDRDPLAGQIEEFLQSPVPADWQHWNAERRRLYWFGSGKSADLETVPRDRVCAAEIWCECLRMNGVLPKMEAHRLNGILENLPGWERCSTIRFGGGYGRQKGFKRVRQLGE